MNTMHSTSPIAPVMMSNVWKAGQLVGEATGLRKELEERILSRRRHTPQPAESPSNSDTPTRDAVHEALLDRFGAEAVDMYFGDSMHGDNSAVVEAIQSGRTRAQQRLSTVEVAQSRVAIRQALLHHRELFDVIVALVSRSDQIPLPVTVRAMFGPIAPHPCGVPGDVPAYNAFTDRAPPGEYAVTLEWCDLVTTPIGNWAERWWWRFHIDAVRRGGHREMVGQRFHVATLRYPRHQETSTWVQVLLGRVPELNEVIHPHHLINGRAIVQLVQDPGAALPHIASMRALPK